jgi:hypothetical protein
MRRPLLSLLAASLLLSACSAGGRPDAAEQAESVPSAAATPAPASAPAGTASPRALPSPPAIEGLVVVDEELSREHREGPIEYDTLPPVGGPHHPRWLACDVYDEPVPAEVAVHSLEHGAVWLTYAPSLPDDQVAQLAELAGLEEEYVLVSPLRGLDSRIVAVAWGASLEVSAADDPRLREFLAAYAGGGQGGEPGAPCRTNGLSLREARALLQTQA